MTESLSQDEFAQISRELYNTLRDFRAAMVVRTDPTLQVRTWQLMPAEWSGGIWCNEPDCGCEAENSQIGDFTEGDFTLTDLNEAIAEHIAEKAERDAENS